jgi:hypothetical protein
MNVKFVPSVIPLLASQRDAISACAAAVLVSAIPDAPNREQLLTADLAGFLARGSAGETILSAAALRLAGASSSSLVGAQRLGQQAVTAPARTAPSSASP